jgi:hypothetical protein
MATTGQIPWPPPGTTHDRHRAGLTTAPGQISMALDTSCAYYQAVGRFVHVWSVVAGS